MSKVLPEIYMNKNLSLNLFLRKAKLENGWKNSYENEEKRTKNYNISKNKTRQPDRSARIFYVDISFIVHE